MKPSRFLVKTAQAGFTLIELIIVIVIVGILAAVAIPKYLDLSTDAKTSALQSVAGAIASAAATNYALKSANNTNAVTVATCTAAAGLITMPSDMAVSTGALTAGVLGDCTINYSTSPLATSISFKAIGA